MKIFIREFMKALKWIGITIATVICLVGFWCGSAWLIGAMFELLFKWQDFPSSKYIGFGSVVLVFVACASAIAIVSIMAFVSVWSKNRKKSDV